MSGYDGEGQDHGTADPLEHERTWLEMLWFCAAAWGLLGAAGAGLILAFTMSACAFLFWAPCLIFNMAALFQRHRIRRFEREQG